MVERHGGLCLKWVCPGWSGVPDRIILLPGARVIFAETKRPKGGKLSKLQRWWCDKLQALGFWAVVVWTEDNVNTLELAILDLLGSK
ncbi:MAG: VRR-NUC domain-containing protein [Oscillospiraceae bacterium]|nr:VRR-NUC domain-containing protein [Oscillospiraceae bacterium]